MTNKLCFVLWLSLEFHSHVFVQKFSVNQMLGVDTSAVENVNAALQIMLLFSFENGV